MTPSANKQGRYTGRPLERYINRAAAPPLLDTRPASGLGLVVTIPAYDEPDVLGVLDNLQTCDAPPCAVEVIVLVNEGMDATERQRTQNRATTQEVLDWNHRHHTPRWNAQVVHVPPLPSRWVGVGSARKLAMDEALRRLVLAGQPDGIIACLDADCRVKHNYLCELYAAFRSQPDLGVACVYFEHPIENSPDGLVMARYELFLRYYRLGLRLAGSAHAYHSVGSCITVRASAYARQGGMNRRQAGEDFYFLQKLVDGESVTELTTTTVMPAARHSDRVPFGTGHALKQGARDANLIGFYHPEVFIDLKAFFELAPDLFIDPDTLQSALRARPVLALFLASKDAGKHLREIRKNVATQAAFIRRVKRWCNGFMCMKYARFASPQHYAFQDPVVATKTLLQLCHEAPSHIVDVVDALDRLRRLEINGEGIQKADVPG
ncbi:MAG: glycosyltransferase [Chromatiales bacterium]|jgi:hypothetical protein|nr:glycosyltransferase [Chromatiales bacterium]